MTLATINANKDLDKIEVSFTTLARILPEAGKNLRVATLALRSAFSVADANIDEFIQLRRSVVGDANAYRFQILPVAKESTNKVKSFMDYFTTLEMEEILGIADVLTEDAQAGHKLMVICRDCHKGVSACFKKQQDKADKVLATCELQKKHYEEQAAKEREWADWHQGWAVGLAFIPGVNLIACPLLCMEADSNLAKAVAAQEETQLAVNASFIIRDCLVEGVGRYVEAMDTFAATFQLLALEIDKFINNLDRLKDTEKAAFHRLCKKNAEKVESACDAYLTMAIAAETDLMALPESDDLNYVQTWLATHQAEDEAGMSFRDRLRSLGKGLPRMLTALVS
jgi:hypothetical protein